MEKIALKIKNWIKDNPLEFWFLAAILLVGAVSRLYNIAAFMTFLGDEGRDVIIVRRLLTEGHPPLIGPGTSIGGMYLGPLYYYMMAPGLLLAAFSPVGPAVEVAILGIITIWFVWYVGRTWFGKAAGLIAAGLYAVSPTVIIYSRSSWNPNIMPFFALLSVYSVWKVWKEKKFNWLMVLGFSFAGVIQSHYLGFLLVPTLFLFWLLTFVRFEKWYAVKNWSGEIKSFIQKSLIGFGIFAVLMSPLFFFDIRHNWMNTRAFYTFFTVRQTTVSIKPWTSAAKIYPIFTDINASLLSIKNTDVSKWVTGIIIAAAAFILYRKNIFKKKSWEQSGSFLLLISWVLSGLIGLGLYKQQIYDHYYGFLFPAIFLLVGVILQKIYDSKLKILSIIIVIAAVVVSLNNSPLLKTPNNQLQRAENVAKKIEVESAGARFNLGVIAERNYEDGYKYFLLRDNQPVVSIDSQSKDTITDQLFVVCELEKSKCDPTHNATAAVANFGWSKIESSWEVNGVMVYKLVHAK
jgi:4-amino-4-deoxy-L-arabinose transferase-like glycosyltransferase